MALTRTLISCGALLAISPAGIAQTRPFHVVDLGVVPGQAAQAGVGASGISRDGTRICGTSVWEPYVHERVIGMRALQKLVGYPNGEVFAVNGSGIAVGSCGLLTTGTSPITAVVWDALGIPTRIPPVGSGTGGAWSRAVGINDQGQVIGNSTMPGGAVHAFSWTPGGGLVDLTPNAQSASALDLNEAGQICLVIDGATFRFTPGAPLLPLGTFVAERINSFGQMAGYEVNQSVVSRYTDGIGLETLPSTNGFREVSDINDFGQIVATQWVRVTVSPPTYNRYGHLYTPGLGFQLLDTLVSSTQSVRVGTASGIDEYGNIAAEGSIGSLNRAMLLENRFVTPYGASCPGTLAVKPRLSAAGTPAAGNRLALLCAGGARSGTGLILLSGTGVSIPLPGGCTLLVDLVSAIPAPVTFNPIGQGHLVLVLPIGIPRVSVHAQLASIDPGASNGIFTLSNGVRIDLQ